jgi:type I restriction enzyme R subunit
MAGAIDEAAIEEAALDWLEGVGWTKVYGETIGPGEPAAERTEFTQTTLDARLRDALARLNPDLPASAVEDAFKRLLRAQGPDLVSRNRAAHRMLVDGVTVEYRAPNGQIRGTQVRVIDFEHPENNDFLAVNQFTVVEGKTNRRPDVVLFVNGLPLAVFELKNAADEHADVNQAYSQLETYLNQIPKLFEPNALLVISDGRYARVGSITAGRELSGAPRHRRGSACAGPAALLSGRPVGRAWARERMSVRCGEWEHATRTSRTSTVLPRA